jgi:CNT family concentrative nucleoside transporter
VARFTGLLGVVVLLGLAWLLSDNRRAIRWRTVAWGLGLQLTFAVVILRTAPGQLLFDWARAGVNRLLSFTDRGPPSCGGTSTAPPRRSRGTWVRGP